MTTWLRIPARVLAAAALIMLGGFARPLFVADPAPTAITLSDTEIGFAQDMTAHHQQALLMVQRLDPAADRAVRGLATQIADGQRLEIGTMLGWLRLVNAPPTTREPMRWMGNAEHAGHGASMPGMASTEELGALAAARGHDAEIFFLQLMLRHHEGGIAMAQSADRLLTSGPVKESARAMLADQAAECGIMGLLLDQRGAQALR